MTYIPEVFQLHAQPVLGTSPILITQRQMTAAEQQARAAVVRPAPAPVVAYEPVVPWPVVCPSMLMWRLPWHVPPFEPPPLPEPPIELPRVPAQSTGRLTAVTPAPPPRQPWYRRLLVWLLTLLHTWSATRLHSVTMIKSLGYVTVPVPGTPMRATANATDPTQRIGAQTILLQVLPANVGIVYVGSFEGFNKATGDGVLAILQAPSDPTTGPFPGYAPTLPTLPAGLNVADLWIDVDVADDGVCVSFTQG